MCFLEDAYAYLKDVLTRCYVHKNNTQGLLTAKGNLSLNKFHALDVGYHRDLLTFRNRSSCEVTFCRTPFLSAIDSQVHC